VTRYVRYRANSATSYGVLEGATIHEIAGGLFGDWQRTGVTHAVEAVSLLCPCEPSKILAVGRNYKSHLGDRQAPDRPEMFYKPVSALQHPGGPIRIPQLMCILRGS
jgi:2-keto-4-pentenoate hydratase/2-oxohepta-3-ene-1,7-dioic acid hydratase in catechol pathway